MSGTGGSIGLGGWRDRRRFGTAPVTYGDYASLRDEGLLADERIELLLSWRHTGFSVHNTVTVEPAGTERLARYLLRPPLSLERMSFDETGTVLYRRKAQSPHLLTPPPHSRAAGLGAGTDDFTTSALRRLQAPA